MSISVKNSYENTDSGILVSVGFLTGLLLLFCNDFFLKDIFHNRLTGKLSDFAGLFVFPLFWIAFFPNCRRLIIFFTAAGFIFWKTPYSDFVINFWNAYGPFYIQRIVDYSDYWALIVLLPSYWYSFRFRRIADLANPWIKSVIILFASLSFIATGETYPDRSIVHHKGDGIYCDQFDRLCKKEVQVDRGQYKYYLSDLDGQVIGDSILYDDISVFESRYPIVREFLKVQMADKYGVINYQGELVYPIRYDEIDLSSHDDIRFGVRDTMIYLNVESGIFIVEDSLSNTIVISPLVHLRTESQYRSTDNPIRIYNKENKPVTPYQYKERSIGVRVSDRYQTLEISFRNHKEAYYTVFSKEGVLLESLTNSSLAAFKQFSFREIVHVNDKVTLRSWEKLLGLDTTYLFDELIPNLSQSTNRIIIKSEGVWGIMDSLGQQILKPQYKRIKQFSDGLAGFQENNDSRYGFLDENGAVKIAPKYHYVGDFKYGLAPAQVELKSGELRFGYINKKGNFAIEPQFEEALNFDSNGWALIRKENMYYYIDRKGNINSDWVMIF